MPLFCTRDTDPNSYPPERKPCPMKTVCLGMPPFILYIVLVHIYHHSYYCPYMDIPPFVLLFMYGHTTIRTNVHIWSYNHSYYCPYMGIPPFVLMSIYGHTTIRTNVHIWAYHHSYYCPYMGIPPFVVMSIYGHTTIHTIVHIWSYNYSYYCPYIGILMLIQPILSIYGQ